MFGYGRRQPARKSTLFELAISLIIIIALIGTVMVFLHRLTINAKETTLQVELRTLRLSLLLYQALKGRNPQDLKVLIETKLKPRDLAEEVIFGKDFLEAVGRDKEGYPVDSFGKRFYYNPKKGVIRSQVKKYEQW